VLTRELDFSLMFYNCGNLNLAHSEAALKGLRLQVASAQFNGIESYLLEPKECKELVPALDISDRPVTPSSEACTILRAASCVTTPWYGAWPGGLQGMGFTSIREQK
jgi:L-2-hydroxyglutarate oxidase LhgO